MSNNICDSSTDLSNVSDWLDANMLSLHIGKTCCMLVCSQQRNRIKPFYWLNNNVTFYKYVGIL